MEALIFIAILALVGYLIHQNLPSTKFAKANELSNQSKFLEAIAIYQSLFGKIAQAPAKLAECKLKLGLNPSTSSKDALANFNFILELKKRLPSNVDRVLFEKVEAKAGLQLAKIFYEAAHQKGKALPEEGIKLLSTNIEYISGLCKTGSDSEYQNLLQKHYDLSASFHYICGMNAEKMDLFDQAVISYNQATQFFKSHSESSANAEARIGICQLKKAQKEQVPLNPVRKLRGKQ